MRIFKEKNVFTYNFTYTDEWACNENREELNINIKLDKYFVFDTKSKEYGVYYKASCPNYTTWGCRDKYDAIHYLINELNTDGVLYMRLKEHLYSLDLWRKL